jgi:hypothetical protein
VKPYDGPPVYIDLALEPGLMVAMSQDHETQEISVCLQVGFQRVLISVQEAREIAAALTMVAGFVERGEAPEYSMFVPEFATREQISATVRWNHAAAEATDA